MSVNSLLSMRVRLTFSTGHQQVIQAEKLEYELECRWEECRHLFYHQWQHAKYCSDECEQKAKNLRDKLRRG